MPCALRGAVEMTGRKPNKIKLEIMTGLICNIRNKFYPIWIWNSTKIISKVIQNNQSRFE